MGSWINCIQIHDGSEKLIICNVYRSPSSSVSVFCDNILELADKLVDIEQISSYILDILNEIAPMKRKLIKFNWKNKPWINEQVINTMKQRDNAFKIARISQSSIDLNNYKILRNKVVHELRENKKKYYEYHIDNNKRKPQKMWKTLKDLIGDKKRNYSEICEIKFGSEAIADEQLITNKMNEYFISSIENIVSEIDNQNSNYKNGNNEILCKWEVFEDVDYDIIDKVINGLDCRKGSKNEINARLVKLIWKTKSDIILYMIKSSLKFGIVPHDWKISTIIPIQKVAGSVRVEDLRPINTLPLYEQILEHIVKIQLSKFIDDNNIINPEQSGFRRNHSCETALQHSIINWRKDLDKGLFIGVVFVDFARAFETINRDILIQILYESGIDGVLGTDCKLFADDMRLAVSCNNINMIENKLNNSLGLLSEWLSQHQLKINVKKTVYMIIHDQRLKDVRNKCKLFINGSELKYVRETKYLGIMIDDNLNFSSNAVYGMKS
ncbi:uncharacterized protein LOC130672900 [Microplitis mediator]|uniref:uncharacterized protein LOC130672900 n=1 Tax=Microplitis mediator TaxID=375433 RepID=UPI0025526CB8|nr:uncharacterized protein LOC130672900 [Microplitis mediator]